MKRILLVVLAVLLMASVSYAATIPSAVDAVNNREIWVTSVYIDELSSVTVDAGNVVCWNVGDSTGDDKNWVENCDAETGLVAGVIWPADITGGSVGLMAIHGPVTVDILETGGGSAATEGAPLCSSSTAGTAKTCTTVDTEAYSFGHAAAAATSAAATVSGFLTVGK